MSYHVLQDIASKILTFSQQGPRIVCVLSANGAVSHVTLRQPSVSGGTMTYEVYPVDLSLLIALLNAVVLCLSSCTHVHCNVKLSAMVHSRGLIGLILH